MATPFTGQWTGRPGPSCPLSSGSGQWTGRPGLSCPLSNGSGHWTDTSPVYLHGPYFGSTLFNHTCFHTRVLGSIAHKLNVCQPLPYLPHTSALAGFTYPHSGSHAADPLNACHLKPRIRLLDGVSNLPRAAHLPVHDAFPIFPVAGTDRHQSNAHGTDPVMSVHLSSQERTSPVDRYTFTASRRPVRVPVTRGQLGVTSGVS